MKDNPLKWLIKGPIYLLLSPIWVCVYFFALSHVALEWAFSNGSWENARKKVKRNHACGREIV